MNKVLVQTQEDWVKLVAQWVKGIGSFYSAERSTNTLEELKGFLGSRMVWDEKRMSVHSLKFSNELAASAVVRPPDYPCLVLYQFRYETFFPAVGEYYCHGEIFFITPDDFETE